MAVRPRGAVGVTAVNKILVSGCLNGPPIRFDATNVRFASEIWERWLADGRIVAFCPELGAGFAVPRAPAEIVDGTAADVIAGNARVLEDNGTDVTDMFVTGARLALARARDEGCVAAVLTDGSPTCGSTYTFDGTFEGGTVPGMGVAAQVLRDAGIRVFPESRLADADSYLRSLGELRDGRGR